MRRISAVTALAFFIGACGGDDGPGSSATTAVVTTALPPSDGTAADGEDLPGDEIELYPYEGASLAVVGVERDDTFVLRAGPGDDFDVVLELPPLATDLIATGHNRLTDDAMWVELDKGAQRGWGDARYLLQLGNAEDITAELTDPAGQLPRAPTMDELAIAVGEQRASDEPPSRLAIIEEPELGDLGSITVDVIGLGDDAVGGERLHILAEPLPGGDGFVVESVRRLSLCSRGVTVDGLCV